MALTISEARNIVQKELPKGSTVVCETEYDGMYLFIAYRPDPLEGQLDPFFSVDPKTGYFRDFSPQDYSKPREVLEALDASPSPGKR